MSENLYTAFIGLCVFSALVVAQESLPDPESCSNPGERYGDTIVGYTSTTTQEDCFNECQQNQFCSFFTWFDLEKTCVLYAECDGFNATICESCLTGAKDCSLYDCFTPGICLGGGFLDTNPVTDQYECLDFCKNNINCKWFNYEPENNNICGLVDNCTFIDESCSPSNCIHGQVECQSNAKLNIMVAIGMTQGQGYNSDHVEVINTNTIESCPNLPAAYPEGLEVAMTVTSQERVVICGGLLGGDPYTTSDCYSYDSANNKWDIEAFRLAPERYAAASVEIRPNEWMISGGIDDHADTLMDTQIFKDGQFFPGPNLPIPMQYHCAVMLNDKHLFVGTNSDRNFILDIDTDEWTEVANKPSGTLGCTNCGTFYNSTADEVQVAFLADYFIETYSPKRDSWISGISFPSPVTSFWCSTTIQQGLNSFVFIGGEVNNQLGGNIYHFDESGMKIIKENVLTEPRIWHVAIPIHENQFTC